MTPVLSAGKIRIQEEGKIHNLLFRSTSFANLFQRLSIILMYQDMVRVFQIDLLKVLWSEQESLQTNFIVDGISPLMMR